ILTVLKKRFRIICIPPEYNLDIQSCIPPALCFIHNVIRFHDPDDTLDYHRVDSDEWGASYDSSVLADGPPTNAACTRAHEVRDEIAQSMWVDYLQERLRRGQPLLPDAQVE
ncbi:hypothetical protein P692DRAFT_201716055, partial [Suillus brevipes Sb2]